MPDLIKKFSQDAEILDIKEPPCSHCIFFRPHRNYDEFGIFAGIRLCNYPNQMCPDFSCFKEK